MHKSSAFQLKGNAIGTPNRGSLTRETVKDVLLGGDGAAVHHGGAEAPVADGGHDFFVDAMAEALKDLGCDDVALHVDGDLDDNGPLNAARYLPGVNLRVWKKDGKRGADIMAGEQSVDY